jgi:tetraacyldisaccharide 4'-kinase
MKRLWETAVQARGIRRLYYSPFLMGTRLLTPTYQYFSRRQLQKRAGQCSGGWKAKVISIGNITVGGTGKTPVIGCLARQSILRGKKVCVVHSGYGRLSREDILIDYGGERTFSAEQVGDEVAMLKREFPEAGFAIGRDKKKMTALADEKLRPDIILIDDGYQRRDIEKDVDIVIVDAETMRAIRDGEKSPALRLFPSGIMREDLTALGRADAIFITGGAYDKNRDAGVLREFNAESPMLTWTMAIPGVDLDGVDTGLDVLYDKRPYLFAGIGSFARLVKMLDGLGIKPVGKENPGDHFQYKKSDIERLNRVSTSKGADCYLTTAKDMVKLPPTGLDKPAYCLKLMARPDDEAGVNVIIGWDEK